MEIHYSDEITEVVVPTQGQKILRLLLWVIGFMLFMGLLLAGYVWQLSKPPVGFPIDEQITIEEGSTVRDITEQFAAANYTQSELLLYLTIVMWHDPTTLKASLYSFDEPISVFELAHRLTEGDYGIDLERFVHYEGERVTKIAERAEVVLLDFDSEKFIELGLPKEGKLFPDTYLIPETYSAEELIATMEETYESRVAPLRPAIEASGFTEEEVITLASIIEREANTRESKRMVAGIINNRLDEGMPLQLDASIEYALDTPLNELAPGQLAEELRTNDSPYNTYLNPGLPPTPIGNPGLTSIEAVLEPIESNYFFYLTDRSGRFHYAQTGAQHQANVNAYLR